MHSAYCILCVSDVSFESLKQDKKVTVKESLLSCCGQMGGRTSLCHRWGRSRTCSCRMEPWNSRARGAWCAPADGREWTASSWACHRCLGCRWPWMGPWSSARLRRWPRLPMECGSSQNKSFRRPTPKYNDSETWVQGYWITNLIKFSDKKHAWMPFTGFMKNAWFIGYKV